MAHNATLKARCEELYVAELLTPEEIVKATGVPLATFYRWRKDLRWDKLRDLELGMHDKLGQLLLKLMDEQLEQEKIDAQALHGMVNTLEKYQKTGTIRERLVFEGDAEVVIETMKEMAAFSSLLEDPAVLSELGEKLREKRRG